MHNTVKTPPSLTILNPETHTPTTGKSSPRQFPNKTTTITARPSTTLQITGKTKANRKQPG